MKYGFSDEERKAFKEWLIKTDYIAAPQKIYTDERVFERQEVCRDYLEREELKVIASPFHRPDGKCCTKCGVWKPFAAFYPNGKGGISSDCRDCRNNAYKLYYEKHLKRSTVKVDPPEFKVCRTCGERKPISEYRKSRPAADGHVSVCRKCYDKKFADTWHQRYGYGKEGGKKRSTNQTKESKDMKPTATAEAEPHTKKCKECGRILPLDAFSKNARAADGRQTVCKECMRTLIRKGKVSASHCVTSAAVEEPKMERLTPEVIKPYPVVEHGEEIVTEPLTLIESPHWIGLIPDDDLYCELVRRGWEGEMVKRLKKT